MKRILAALLLLTLAAPAWGQDYIYDERDYREWRPLAERGIEEAQTRLGVMYQLGQGVPKDYAEALKWFRLAADQGYAEAQFGLGDMYYWGRLGPQDYTKAAKWYRRPPSRGTLTRSSASALCTNCAGASLRTTPRR